jgi:3-dehydroquinate dehydratase/shikimate dehydrogenase
LDGIFGKERICGVIASRDAAGAVRQVAAALRETRMIELRLDWLRSRAEIRNLLRWLARKSAARGERRFDAIATCRRRVAGGRFTGTIGEQVAILCAAAGAGCAWLDLEIESAEKISKAELAELRLAARLLISYHNFRATPAKLAGVRAQLKRAGGDAIKIAAQAKTYRDACRLLELARASRRIVAVPMGEIGAAARILALRGGSALAYAPVEEATAPGQIGLRAMTSIYRAERVDRSTSVYGVIGNPIGHSLSPQMQNAGFHARRIHAVYVAFLVRNSSHALRDFLGAIGPLGIKGFSVTIPHKEAILEHLDDCDPLAAAIGAVNTVVVLGGGKLYGYNTDYVGVLRALERRVQLAGSCVLILGAGGAARAVAFALARAGASVRVCARRPARAKALARAVGGEAIERRRLRSEYFDAIVNATPVGMHPNVKASPLRADELNCRLVFDLIYRPRRTRLLEIAERRGIETVSGAEMFVAQGTAQWEIWTGERAPEVAMRRAVEEGLGAENGK